MEAVNTKYISSSLPATYSETGYFWAPHRGHCSQQKSLQVGSVVSRSESYSLFVSSSSRSRHAKIERKSPFFSWKVFTSPTLGGQSKIWRSTGSLLLATPTSQMTNTAEKGFSELAQDLQELIVSRGGAAVIDGGLATELERKGADIHDPLWSAKYLIEDPDLIEEVHRDYLESGSDVIVSASYQASLQGFEARGLSREQGADLLRLSVRIAKKARDEFWALHLSKRENEGEDKSSGMERRRPLVGASVGPYAAYLADGSEYTGVYGPSITIQDLVEFHRERLQIFAAERPDLFAFETIPCKLEAEAIAIVLEEEQLGIPAWISFNSNDGVHVPSGDHYADCAAIADSCDSIVALGVNCTAPPLVQSLLDIAAKVTKKPLLVYPNSGDVYDGETKNWKEQEGSSDDVFHEYVPVWREAGARLIGGCCRTTPHTVKCILAAIKLRNEHSATTSPAVDAA